MNDRSWKAFKRRLARLENRRVPVTGERDRADFEDYLFRHQAKQRDWIQAPPTHLPRRLDGIVGRAQPAGRIGVVVWQRGPRTTDREALVVLRFCDWVDLGARAYLAAERAPSWSKVA